MKVTNLFKHLCLYTVFATFLEFFNHNQTRFSLHLLQLMKQVIKFTSGAYKLG